MKKTIKKLAALLLAGALAATAALPAFADPTTYALSVNVAKDATTHTYKVYQIYTGTPDNGKLTDVQYGSSYPGGKTGAVPKTEIDAIFADANKPDFARSWAKANANSIGTEVATLNGTTTAYNAVPGWYLILDTNYVPTTDNPDDAYSAYMMVQVLDKDESLTPKRTKPSVDKQVQDETADAEAGATDGWGESADHEIGKTFQFKLIATLPADVDYSAYDTYPITFNDSMSDGVTFESIDSVKIGTTDVAASKYTCTAIAGQAGGAWTLSIADAKALGVDITSGTTITVIYNAHLNTSAIVSDESGNAVEVNNNKVSLTYNNNPDATGSGNTATTPEDYVWVFTYHVYNNKVDKNDKPVEGAGFTLYPDGSETAIPLYKVGTKYYKYDADKTDYPAGGSVVSEIVTTADGGNVFDIVGLDVGKYTLKETTVPEGYVQCDDIDIEISAVHTEANNKTSADLTLTTKNVNNKIVNLTGTTLPSTGGMGTTIFYVIGGILVLAAAIILISRRRVQQ